MSFVCDQPAIFTNSVMLSNVVGTTHVNGKMIVNSDIIVNDLNIKNNLFIDSENIFDIITDVSNNIDIIYSQLDEFPDILFDNQYITDSLSTKQDKITDLYTSGLLSPGTNISFDISDNNITINSVINTVYFVCYVSVASTTTSGNNLPRTIVMDSIARQYPTTGTFNNGGYIIQQSGTYWIHSSVAFTAASGQPSTTLVIELTRNGVSSYIHFFADRSTEDNSIIYNCIVNDIIKVRQIQGTNVLTYYGSGDSSGNNIMTTLQGYKLS